MAKRIREQAVTNAAWTAVAIDVYSQQVLVTFDDGAATPTRVLGFVSLDSGGLTKLPVYADSTGVVLDSWRKSPGEVNGRITAIYLQSSPATATARVVED